MTSSAESLSQMFASAITCSTVTEGMIVESGAEIETEADVEFPVHVD
jgi:hypothetical protein